MPGQPLPHAHTNGLAAVNVRAMYGLAKETWNTPTGTVFISAFCVTATTASSAGTFRQRKSGRQPALRRLANGTFDRALPGNIELDDRKPTCSTPQRLAH